MGWQYRIINFYERSLRIWTKLRLRPIHVFCLHHVCKSFDGDRMNSIDWTDIQDFKNRIQHLQKKGVHFISLTDAYKRIANDSIRFKRYAVITFDDGYSSIKEVLPWLKDRSIPVALFVNTDYNDGKAYRVSNKERYLTRYELSALDVEIGMHGLQHIDVSKMEMIEFREYVKHSFGEASQITGFIPFWAYTWGLHNPSTDKVLKDLGFVPVLMDGYKNYHNTCAIHRERFL